MEKLLVDKEYLLHKFEGKGGWTYAEIPEVPQDKHAPFGWVRVKGSIDGYPIVNYRLMPMGNGQLFLPIKAEIRKKIDKQAGDTVRVVLYTDSAPILLPDEFKACLEDEPATLHKFMAMTEGEQKAFIDWIYSAQQENTKIARMVKTLSMVAEGQRLNKK